MTTERLVLRAEPARTDDPGTTYFIEHQGAVVGAMGLVPTDEPGTLALLCRIEADAERLAAGVARDTGFVARQTVHDDEGPIQIWFGEREPAQARAAVARACRHVGDVAIAR